MNPIVFAMRRPLTVMVLVVAVALGSVLAVTRMSIDIFPNLNLPVIYVAQPYGGMDPAQMEGLLTNYYEYHFLYITGIHHVESRNIQGMALMKLFFHPGTNMAQAMAETIGYVTRSRGLHAAGDGLAVHHPVRRRQRARWATWCSRARPSRSARSRTRRFSRSGRCSPACPASRRRRPSAATSGPSSSGLDPDRLRSYRISPDEVITALTAGNTISPSGNVRIGKMMPIVPINSLVRQVKELETIPIRPGQNPAVYLRDVATVQDATDIPTGYALVNGRRAVYILVTKRADASTLSVVHNVKEALPKMQAVLPDDIKVSFEFDQSPTVTNAVRSLATEGALGPILTGLMVLLFLRDWRSVIVVVLNIPFALCGALVALWLTGQTINLMTLGGLALAIGILVDEATVEIENIHHKMEGTDSVARRSGGATWTRRCPGSWRCSASWRSSCRRSSCKGRRERCSSRSRWPSASRWSPLTCCRARSSRSSRPGCSAATSSHERRHQRRSLFRSDRDAYGRALRGVVRWRWVVVPAYLVLGPGDRWRRPRLGLEIFPEVDAGRFQLRMRAPTGTRIEETEKLAIAGPRNDQGRGRAQTTSRFRSATSG